jgi:hypothetical protein
MRQSTKTRFSSRASTEAVKFTDGMLVTAEDLTAAMNYPLSVAQVLWRSFFGCGIVCGLELADTTYAGRTGDYDDAREVECPPERSFVIRVNPGVALGCDGYPIELCESVKLDLSPDRCACPIEGETVKFIAIRRTTAQETPRADCGCGGGGADPALQCSRTRDLVLVQAFDSHEDLPKGICGLRPGDPAAPDAAPQSLCECMKRCPTYDRCGDPWVLLGTVRIDDEGIVAGGVNDLEDSGVADGGRRYVKPVACACATVAAAPSPPPAPAPERDRPAARRRAAPSVYGPYSLRVPRGIEGDRALLSCTQDGNVVDLWNEVGVEGRQQWSFEPVGDGYYRIRVSGGVEREGPQYLTGSGQQAVSLAPLSEDVRQQWSIAGQDDSGEVSLVMRKGEEGDHEFLSCTSSGTVVDRWMLDDGSGRQKWLMTPGPLPPH